MGSVPDDTGTTLSVFPLANQAGRAADTKRSTLLGKALTHMQLLTVTVSIKMMVRGGLAWWCIRLTLCVRHRHPPWLLVCVPAAMLLCQLPDAWQSSGGQPWPPLGLSDVTIWGINQHGKLLSYSPSVCNFVFQIKKSLIFKSHPRWIFCLTVKSPLCSLVFHVPEHPGGLLACIWILTSHPCRLQGHQVVTLAAGSLPAEWRT